MGTGLVFGAFCFSDFSFPAQIHQKAVASLHDIAVRRLKISRIPRIRNIAAGTGEGKKFVNLSIRIILQHPVQIADIRGIHADDVVGALVILPCNLLRSGEEVFLDDMTLTELKNALQVKIDIVKSSGQDLLDAILKE